MGFKLNQLRDFVAVARHGSLRAAARDLGLGQPTLTKSIQALEKELGAPLFLRSSNGAVLTAQGSAFLPRARLVLEELRRGREQVAQLDDISLGEVSVGLCPISCSLFLTPALEAFRRRYPTAPFRIVEDGHSMSLLRDGELDFVVGPRPLATHREEIIVEPLADCDVVLLVREGHPLAGAETLAELLAEEWIRPLVVGRPPAKWEAMFRVHDLPPPARQLEVDNIFAAFHLMLRANAVCVTPRALIDTSPLRDCFREIAVREPLATLPICLMHSAGLPLTPAADLVVNQIRRTANALRGHRAAA